MTREAHNELVSGVPWCYSTRLIPLLSLKAYKRKPENTGVALKRNRQAKVKKHEQQDHLRAVSLV